ncbi:MAG: hypothetical protein M1833_006523 [Piccolia ochrophora]|nr:MAG: hypothetical protein M1833_006523 [Piccolia ochrophora]
MTNYNPLNSDGETNHRPTFPLSSTSRRKPRRWPLVLRFIKGAIHLTILLQIVLHTLWTLLVVFLGKYVDNKLTLTSNIIPSLSIVVGLMLVFRNQTSYERFWSGRMYLSTISTSVRNLSRTFLCCSFASGTEMKNEDRADTERTIRILVAILYSVKDHLRHAWGAAVQRDDYDPAGSSDASHKSEYSDLLPDNLNILEHSGLGLPLELTFFVETYIRRGFDKGWFHAPQASQMQVQLNTLVDSYGSMETIRQTPLPVAYLIHQKQVLALFGIILPFAMVHDMGWWAVPVVTLIMFTLYGIDGIGTQLENPFGIDKNDIKMDAIVEDCRTEIMCLLNEWKQGDEMFAKKSGQNCFGN